MKVTSFKVLAGLFAISSGIGMAAPAAAAFPEKPISVIVPFSAGGGADNAARVLAEGLSKELGQTIVIENKAGASGSIGAGYVARAAADGYTMLYDASSFAINPVLRKLPYNAAKDFIPVSQAISVPNIMVAAANSPFTDLQSYVAAAKKEPGHYTFASYGPGSIAQMIGELVKKDTGIDILHIPYRGGAPAQIDVMGGQVDVYFANAASSLNYITGGKLKALAVTSSTRMKELPNTPTVAESGLKGFNVLEWNGFFLPAGTPADVVKKLETAIQNTIKNPEVNEKLTRLGLTPVGSTSAEFAAFIQKETELWTEVVKANHISIE